ncbi:MAG: Uma2 family endonuclease [Thermoguttaceae bacterium]|jgi:Uma2 family endonuclease
MANSVLFEEQVEIPFVHSLADFRDWAASESFPERGRIDFITGRIEVDMSPEDLFSHGTLKTEIVRALGNIVKAAGMGQLFSDCTRVSSPDADLSVEPDIVFIAEESLDSGRIRLVPKASLEPGRYVELEGPADLIVEIVSDSSATKDTQRLPAAYWRAGVREFWLADARGPALLFQIYHAGPSAYQPAQADSEGFQYSTVLAKWFRLTRQSASHGRWTYDLQEK